MSGCPTGLDDTVTTIKMSNNILHMIQDGLRHIYSLREDTNATRADVLDDLEQRLIHLMSLIVTTPCVDNFLLPINHFDQNDVFLNKDSVVEDESR
jgi:hypothetical protein